MIVALEPFQNEVTNNHFIIKPNKLGSYIYPNYNNCLGTIPPVDDITDNLLLFCNDIEPELRSNCNYVLKAKVDNNGVWLKLFPKNANGKLNDYSQAVQINLVPFKTNRHIYLDYDLEFNELLKEHYKSGKIKPV